MQSTQKSLDVRVRQSLERLDYKNVHVIDEGDGRIKLIAPALSASERPLVLAIARTVAGVTAVSCELA